MEIDKKLIEKIGKPVTVQKKIEMSKNFQKKIIKMRIAEEKSRMLSEKNQNLFKKFRKQCKFLRIKKRTEIQRI